MTNDTMAQRTMAAEDALARGRTLIEEIRAILHRARPATETPTAQARDLYREDQLRESGKFADEGKGSKEAGYERPYGGLRPGEEDPSEWDRQHSGKSKGREPRKSSKPGSIHKDSDGDIVAYVKSDGGKAVFRDKPFSEKHSQATLGMDKNEVKELATEIVDHLPGDIEVTLRSRPADNSVTVNASGDGIIMANTFKVHKTDGLIAIHDYLKLPPKTQGEGTAKKVLKDTLKTYAKLGVARVELQANIDVGAYAWAKFGFKAEHPDALAESLLKGRLDYTYVMSPVPIPSRIEQLKLPKAAEAKVRAVIEQFKDDPRLPWHIAALTVKGRGGKVREVGRELLTMKDVFWQGRLDLKDKESMDRFNKYVNKKSGPKSPAIRRSTLEQEFASFRPHRAGEVDPED